MENVKAAMENAGSAGKAEAINYQSVKQKFQSYLKHPGSFAVYILTSLAAPFQSPPDTGCHPGAL